MASLLNLMLADKVAALTDEAGNGYPADEPRAMPRETALAVIHAALWAYASRASSTAGCYAYVQLYDALGIDRRRDPPARPTPDSEAGS